MSATLGLPAVVTEAGIYLDMPEAEYHGDPVPGGSLSSTGVRRILDSPARFRWEQTHRVEKAEFDVGHYIHAKVLGVGMDVAVLDFDSRRTNAYKAAEDEVRAAGKVPVLAKDVAELDAIAEAVLAHHGARSILEQPGASEVSAFATDPETGVHVRARFDRLAEFIAADLKTTAGSASAAGFGRDAAKYGYPIQEAHYLDTLQWATGERPPMVFIVVEKVRPYLVAVHQFDDITRIAARDLAAKARRIYAECIATDTWPGYGDDVLTTQMPGWWLDAADDDMEEMVI